MKTRKLLAPLDLTKPNIKNTGFLYPNITSEQMNFFVELNSDKKWEFGMVVFIGSEISTNDVFAKIVNSGKKINSVSILLSHIEEYLRQVNLYKIGDIVGIKSLNNGFELIKIELPKKQKNKLPKI
jgi:hypothetical protein